MPSTDRTATLTDQVHRRTKTSRSPVPTPDGTGDRAIWPPMIPLAVEDRHDRRWTWDPARLAYTHTPNGGGTMIKTIGELQSDCGPIGPAGPSIPDDPDQLAEMYLVLKDRTTRPAGNVFEWVFEHSRSTGLARTVLEILAWDDQHDPPVPPSWPGFTYLGRDSESHVDDVGQAVMELIALGELTMMSITDSWDLAFSCPGVTYGFPAYQTWLTNGPAW